MALMHGLTEENIAAHRKARGELERVAAQVGLQLDESNWLLVKALKTIAYEQRGGSKGSPEQTSPEPSRPGAATPTDPVELAHRGIAMLREQMASAPATSSSTIGEEVCNRMRARRGLAPINFKAAR